MGKSLHMPSIAPVAIHMTPPPALSRTITKPKNSSWLGKYAFAKMSWQFESDF
jgi:hypothetical protein